MKRKSTLKIQSSYTTTQLTIFSLSFKRVGGNFFWSNMQNYTSNRWVSLMDISRKYAKQIYNFNYIKYFISCFFQLIMSLRRNYYNNMLSSVRLTNIFWMIITLDFVNYNFAASEHDSFGPILEKFNIHKYPLNYHQHFQH